MDGIEHGEPAVEATKALIDEMLRTAMALGSIFESLVEELREEAMDLEETEAVLVEMILGSCLPAVEAAGEQQCRTATALIGAVGDRVLDDLHAAAELAAEAEWPPLRRPRS